MVVVEGSKKSWINSKILEVGCNKRRKILNSDFLEEGAVNLVLINSLEEMFVAGVIATDREIAYIDSSYPKVSLVYRAGEVTKVGFSIVFNLWYVAACWGMGS